MHLDIKMRIGCCLNKPIKCSASAGRKINQQERVNVMKKLFLAVLVSLFFVSCVSTYTLKKEDKVFVYSHKVELSQKILNEKLIDYINNNFQSPQDVITTIQDGYIASRGKIQVLSGQLDGTLIPADYYMNFSAAFKFENGSYKVKLAVITFNKFFPSHGYSEELSDSPITKTKIKAIFDTLDADIYEYMYGTMGW